jgi:hypothetical protein
MKGIGRIREWLAVAGLALFTVPVMAQTLLAIGATHAKAAEARSATQHAAVSREYRLHAEALNKEAAAHEKNVSDLVRAMPQVQKWPGLASGQLQTAKSKAVETRRAAREAMALADHHMRLAVEVQATTAGPAIAGN